MITVLIVKDAELVMAVSVNVYVRLSALEPNHVVLQCLSWFAWSTPPMCLELTQDIPLLIYSAILLTPLCHTTSLWLDDGREQTNAFVVQPKGVFC